MGVAVFAPCLLVVVDGCFSLPADAARRLKQLTKCFLVEEKHEYKNREIRYTPDGVRVVPENDGKITEGQKIQKG